MTAAAGGVLNNPVVRPVGWLSTAAAVLAASGAAWLVIRGNHLLMGVTYSFVASSVRPSPWRTPLVIGGLLAASVTLLLASRGPLRRYGPTLIAAAAVVCLVVSVGQAVELLGSFGAVGYAFLLAMIAATWAAIAGPHRRRTAGLAAAGLMVGVLVSTAGVVLTHAPVKADCEGLRPVPYGAASYGPPPTQFSMLGSAGTFSNDWERVSWECRDGKLVSFSSKPFWAS